MLPTCPEHDDYAHWQAAGTNSKVSKLPWAKFFWDDFERDTACLDLATRGAWISILCIMSRSPRPGYLLHATGHPYTDEDTARNLHLSNDEWLAVRSELLRTGVSSQDSHGTLFNRRMVKEAKDRSQERLRRAEERSRGKPESCGKPDKALSHQRKCPEVVREMSGECPGERPEARSQMPETTSADADVVASAAASPPREPVPQPDWSGPDWQVECRDLAIRMIRLHPEPKGNLPYLEAALQRAIVGAVNPGSVLASIESVHAAACAQQSRQPRKNWPVANRWVSDGDYLKGEPTSTPSNPSAKEAGW